MKQKAKILLSLASLTVGANFAFAAASEDPFIQCSDMSYVNEMLDAGEVYRHNGQVKDPYQIMNDAGNEMVRVRLWHNPVGTDGYSAFEDVARTIRSSKAAGMQVMLDFHYSDSWTDPGKQVIPAAWAEYVDDTQKLGDLMYEYTYETLIKLNDMGLMPEIVQIGNENDNGIMNAEPWSEGFVIDWPRHAALFNRGMQAARDAGKVASIQPKLMVHIASSEKLEWWFTNAFEAGLEKPDYIGVSYYTPWTTTTMSEIGEKVNRWRHLFQTEIFIAEVAYPWTLLWNDTAQNMIGKTGLRRGYPASVRGQRAFMIDLTQTLINNGCSGMAYWEPAWISSDRKTLWGIGSHWENMTLFDFRHRKNELHKGAEYLTYQYQDPTVVEFRVAAQGAPKALYLIGDFLGGDDIAVELQRTASGEYVYETKVKAGSDLQFQIFEGNPLADGELKAGYVKDLQTVKVDGPSHRVQINL